MNIKFWSKEELHKVLEAARRESIRNHAMILFAYNFGLRASELAGLTIQNIQTGRLVCNTLKGSNSIDVLIENDADPLLDCKKALQSWLRVREDSGSQFLFISRLGSGMTRDAVADIFENAAAAAGIERGRRNPHIAKHTLLALAYRDGCDVFTLQQLGHHKDLKATSAYIHCSQDEARAKLRVTRTQAAAAA
jgi:integrase/recombinase XerD